MKNDGFRMKIHVFFTTFFATFTSFFHDFRDFSCLDVFDAFPVYHWDCSRQICVIFFVKFVIFDDFLRFFRDFLQSFCTHVDQLRELNWKKGMQNCIIEKIAMVDPGFIAVLLRFY